MTRRYKIEIANMSDDQDTKESYAMELLFRDHHVVLLGVCFVSLILGAPLALNMLWHLQVRKKYLSGICAFRSFMLRWEIKFERNGRVGVCKVGLTDWPIGTQ